MPRLRLPTVRTPHARVRWLRAAAEAFASNARRAPLRRAQTSFALAWTAEQTFAVALSVVAYEHGGAAAVGLLTAVRSVPGALAPLAVMPVVSRYGARPVLIGSCFLRAVATAVIAIVVLTHAPFGWIYLLAIAATAAHTVYRPAHSALLPPLSRTPTELVNANAVRGLSDSGASLLGPALAGVILGAAGASVAFWVVTGISAAAGIAAVRIGAVGALRPEQAAHEPAPKTSARALLRGSPDLRLLLALAAVQTFARGVFAVLVVVVSMKVLGAGASGVGTLTAAVGAGALIGSLCVATLTSRRLARWFGVGVIMWGLPLAALSLTSSLGWAALVLAPIGLGNALVDVSAFTLLGRLSSPAAAPRVFGLLESVIALSVAAGSLAAPVLVDLVGVRTTLAGVGLAVPAVVLLAWLRLTHIDSLVGVRDERITLLRRVEMLRPLTLPTLEQLARALEPVRFDAGDVVFAQGDPGDRYYVIEAGAAEVVGDGRGIRTLGAGDGFGEIALLRRVPRTATVRASSPLRGYAMGSAAFVAAVTGSVDSREQAAREMAEELQRFAPRQRTQSRPHPQRERDTIA